MTGKLVVMVTCANAPEAGRIARTLVGERLAACVNIQSSPVRSIYRWKGKVERARETLMLVKTSARIYRKLERRIRQLHSYQTPEIIALPIASGSRAYLDWLDQSLAPEARNPRKKKKQPA